MLSYVSFLEGLADLTNARALFERALSAGPALQAAAKLWDAYVRFEFEHGDRAGVAAVEARRWEALGDAAPPDDLALLLLKYRCAAVLVVWTRQGILCIKVHQPCLWTTWQRNSTLILVMWGHRALGPVAMHNPATAALRACSGVGTIRQ